MKMEESTTFKYGRLVLDAIVLIIEIILLICFAVNAFNILPPFHRGFFCDDESLMYQFKGDTVTNSELFTVSYLFFPVLVFVVELIHVLFLARPYKQYLKKLACSWYNIVSIFFIGFFLNTLVLEIVKLSTGRLRPHYFDTCKPDNGLGPNCKALGYVTNYTCTNTNSLQVADSSQSFPSGHSSSSTFAMFYAVIYLEMAVRRQWRIMRLLCPIIQTLLISYAFFVCVSRVDDNRHHPTDVLVGAIWGTVGSFLTMYFLSDLLEYKAITSDQDEDTENVPISNWKRTDTTETDTLTDTNGAVSTPTYGSTTVTVDT